MGLFNLGQTVMTPGVSVILKDDPIAQAELMTAFAKHHNGNWGNLCDEDKAMNDRALIRDQDGHMQGRLLSKYKVAGEAVYLLTEWDESVTTALLPDEY
jgi:hypothetical protein